MDNIIGYLEAFLVEEGYYFTTHSFKLTRGEYTLDHHDGEITEIKAQGTNTVKLTMADGTKFFVMVDRRFAYNCPWEGWLIVSLQDLADPKSFANVRHALNDKKLPKHIKWKRFLTMEQAIKHMW